MATDLPEGEPSEDDTELVKQLKRVGSDLKFRRWTRKRVLQVFAVVLLDILATSFSVYALVRVNDAIRRIDHAVVRVDTFQQDACQADNALRDAYVKQWQPVLGQPPAPLPDNATQADIDRYNAGLRTRDLFEQSLKTGFAQHSC